MDGERWTVDLELLRPPSTVHRPYSFNMLVDAVEWLGHSGFRVTVGRQRIYVDPYRVSPEAPKADLILITHGHYDHFSPQDVERLSTSATEVIAPAAVAERLNGRVRSIAPGDEIEPKDVRWVAVRALPAYNTSKRNSDGEVFHPRAAGGVGYELNVRGERLYHAGDTDVIPEMDSVHGVDVALRPVSGRYVMTASEAAEAARRIQPRTAVPMHWGENLGTRDDAVAFAREAPAEVEVVIMEKAVV
jgi:L-ascorbate metabolism protein UlaG (beta-lactamase superfamily)